MLRISLKFRREDFEEFYFKNNQGDIFWSKPVKQHFVLVLVFASIFFISLSYSLYTETFWGLPIFSLVVLIISYFTYKKHASPIITWKKQVIKYLDDLSKIKKYELFLTNEALTITQDEEVIITKWAAFTKGTFTEDSIVLAGSDNYVFPKKSMSLSDYKYIKEFISDKLQNGL